MSRPHVKPNPDDGVGRPQLTALYPSALVPVNMVTVLNIKYWFPLKNNPLLQVSKKTPQVKALLPKPGELSSSLEPT